MGVVLSLTSSCLFAAMYFFATMLAPLGGDDIFGWRALLTLPFVTLSLILAKEWTQVVNVARRALHAPMLILGLFVSGALLGLQQWLFLWAPVNGKALEVSLGYFMLPLSMVLVGRVVYGERLSRLQKVAAFCASAGVAHELYRVGSFSWETTLVAAGFPAYFVFRRTLQTDHLGGLWFDMLLIAPAAAYCVVSSDTTAGVLSSARLCLMLGMLALISAIAFICYTGAARALPFGLFGLLGYIEPVLMFGAALAIGERVRAEEWLTYLPIWSAVLFLIMDGFRHARSTELGQRWKERVRVGKGDVGLGR